MSSKANGRARFAGDVKLLVFALLLILPTFACHDRAKSTLTKTRSEIGAEITRLLQQHRYDEAVNLGLSGLTGESEDAVLYRSIAVVYTVRAQNDSKNSERWLQSAVGFVDKSLEARPGDPLNTAAVAEALEAIGDLSDGRKCQLYTRAESLWHLAATQPLDNSKVTTGGQAISNAPIKPAAEPEILRIASKRKANNCP
jgi:hypothetical protein